MLIVNFTAHHLFKTNCFLHLILIISFHLVPFRLRNANTNKIAALLGNVRARRALSLIQPSALTLLRAYFDFSPTLLLLSTLSISGILFFSSSLGCVRVWSCVMCFAECGCKYRQCFTGFFIRFPCAFFLEKRSFLLFFVCFLISYCLALSFSESTSRRSGARYSIHHY